jgi:hypothetical protein
MLFLDQSRGHTLALDAIPWRLAGLGHRRSSRRNGLNFNACAIGSDRRLPALMQMNTRGKNNRCDVPFLISDRPYLQAMISQRMLGARMYLSDWEAEPERARRKVSYEVQFY